MKSTLILIIIFITSSFCFAQRKLNYNFFAGYSFYDGYNIGTNLYTKDYIKSISFSFGYDKPFIKTQQGYSVSIGFNHAILKERVLLENIYKWNLSGRVVFWQLEDQFYLWRVISIIPSINRKLAISEKVNILLDIGPSFNIVLYNKRKTFKEVGWPYHVIPNYRILINF